MKENKTKFITQTAVVAALYVALTLGFSFMSYGTIQFRIAEILVLLVFIDKKYFLGLVLGCAISNAFSPLGMIDVVVGTFATIVALLFIMLIRKNIGDNKKSLIIASLGPVVSNAIFVGIQLTVLFKELPFILNAVYVAIGEFVVVTIAGVLIFSKIKNLLEKN
jgi:uncharacterized membrane protein